MAFVPVVVGVDVGGTNTDAVVIAKDAENPIVLSAIKEPTTEDITTGVRNAIYSSLNAAYESGHKVGVVQVNIGTTHFVNATVQGKGLAKVGVIRLCGSVSHALPPFSDFPNQLADVIRGSVHLVKGGYRFDGRVIDEIDEEEITSIISTLKEKSISCIVLSGVFSPIRDDQEEKVKKIIEREYPEASITLSHKIGHIGLLERENAAILNECIKPLCRTTIDGFQSALKDMGLRCPLYLTQNDGTIISAEDALKHPIYTFASGPTNSMRGAAFLSELQNAIVVDIGGTTTDVGLLKNGFPREASTHVKVGGVKTNFRMPDVISFGLGGGSYVTQNNNQVSVGPLSAGYNLQNEAFVFNKDTSTSSQNLTATDIAVASGLVQLGDSSKVQHLSTDLVTAAKDRIHRMVEETIDKIKLSGEELPVILVGGGSILIDPKRKMAGASTVILPERFGVANAIGAALSQISARVDYVCSLLDMIDSDSMQIKIDEAVKNVTDDPDGKETEIAKEKAQLPFFEEARNSATQQACDRAVESTIKSGADPSTVKITEKEYTTLSYIPGQAIRIKVTAVGNLKDWKKADNGYEAWTPNPEIKTPEVNRNVVMSKQQTTSTGNKLSGTADDQNAILKPSEPFIDPATGEWILSEWDLECIVIGAGIFGCGGGGSPHIGRLRSLEAIRKGKKIRIISPDRVLRDADDENELIVCVAFFGAPLIMYEQLVSSVETTGALHAMQELYSIGQYSDRTLHNANGIEIKTKAGMSIIDDYKPSSSQNTTTKYIGGKKIIALMPAEIGGMNALEPFLVGANLDIPIIDADGMGRAFPELQMFCPYIYGVPPYPATLVDDRNRRAVTLFSPSAKQLEHHFRDTVVGMGCSGGFVPTPLRKPEVMSKSILYSISHAWRLGDAVLRARLEKISPIDAILAEEKSVHLLTGKVQDVQRETTAGFNKGHLILEGQEQFSNKRLLVEFQNENLVVLPLNSEGKVNGEALGCVPDLIVIVDADTGEPITTEEMKYGMRVAILVLASHPLLRTEAALRFVGPQAFRYPDSIKFKPFADAHLTKPIPPK